MALPQSTPPHQNELEVSLFGPGFGECLVVHLGAGEWMVVDSCPNADKSRSIALDYLGQMGVDVAARVKLVVATHWHDDHIQGLGGVLVDAVSARFACSAALRTEEFFALIAADR